MRERIMRLRWDLRRRKALGLGLLLVGIGVLILALLFSVKLTPTIASLALATATDDITIAVNETVARVLSEDGLRYANLVTLERDSQGNITALVSNTAGINLLKAQVTNAIVERFADSDITTVRIPVGNLIGGALFSGRGPRLKLDILSVTNVTTDLRHEFTSAGINQTRHQILMDVEVTLEVLLGPGSDTDTVLTEVSVAETVIVGTVPDTYASFT